MGFFEKIKEGLAKTRNSLKGQIDGVLAAFTSIDEDLFTELEEILITADISLGTTGWIMDELRQRVKMARTTDPAEVTGILREVMRELLDKESRPMELRTSPSVILVIGVNGVGKTTTIGKLAAKYKSDGKKVLMGAADTFRAAAADQLEIWAGRVGCDIVRQGEGADPAAVVYDSIKAGVARGSDVILFDTAGRLHNKQNLMNELEKITRVIGRELPEADREVLLVIDATTGQNGVQQARTFGEIAGVTGVALTKLDGTAKGGIVMSIKDELGIPIRFIGVGEGADDLLEFDSGYFVDALFAE